MIKKILFKLKKYRNNKKIKKQNNTTIRTLNVGNNLIVGKNCEIAKRAQISDNVTIGDNTYISNDTVIDSNVTIGKFCSIAPNVFIAPGVHKYDYVTTHPILFNPYWRKKLNLNEEDYYDKKIGKQDEHTYIGNDVWIALNAIIMRGVKIGDGAIIGAGAIVTKDVEPYSIVVGSPAKHVKYRFDKEDIDKLQRMQTKWWDLPSEEINNLVGSMYDIRDFISLYKDKEGKN